MKSTLAYPNGLTASWTYGNRGELLEVNNASPTGTISRYAYTYDAAGRRVACAKSGSAFTTPDTYAYRYNARSELTNATATVDAGYRYGYDFDDIGNRKTSAERGDEISYSANLLNQYAEITSQTSQTSQTFQTSFDADGNQTLVKTSTGIWSIAYNGENRPVRWVRLADESNNLSSVALAEEDQTILLMSYDRMGRRVTKNDQRFVYDDYLQIANFHSPTPTLNSNFFIWDPTENVSTRPLAWNRKGDLAYYAFDGGKNVSEVFDPDGSLVAHYEYAPFGTVSSSYDEIAILNPFRFSSEYADDDIGLIYHIYRYYDAMSGRWTSVDPVYDSFKYAFVLNDPLDHYDVLGLKDDYLPDIPEVAPELGVTYQFKADMIAKYLAQVNLNQKKHRQENQEEPKCPEMRLFPYLNWRLVKRLERTEKYDYPLFRQRMHIEFTAVHAFTIGGGYSGQVWGFSGTKRVEKRNHVSIVGIIEVNQRIEVKSYEWNCECIGSLYGSNNGSYYYQQWKRYYEEPTFYYVGKWLAAEMSVTPMEGGNSWYVEGQVGGISIGYGEE